MTSLLHSPVIIKIKRNIFHAKNYRKKLNVLRITFQPLTEQIKPVELETATKSPKSAAPFENGQKHFFFSNRQCVIVGKFRAQQKDASRENR